MRQSKALVVAVSRTHPVQHVVDEVRAFLISVVDLLYGTPERTRATIAIASLMLIFSMVLDASASNVCPV